MAAKAARVAGVVRRVQALGKDACYRQPLKRGDAIVGMWPFVKYPHSRSMSVHMC
jgi:hypothetical protein